MKYYFLWMAFAASFAARSQEWTKKYDHVDQCICGLSVVGKGDKHGYADKDGKLVVPLIYDEAMAFSDGFAAVKQNGKWGFLDSLGKLVIP